MLYGVEDKKKPECKVLKRQKDCGRGGKMDRLEELFDVVAVVGAMANPEGSSFDDVGLIAKKSQVWRI